MSTSRIEAVLAAANDIAYEWDFVTDQVTWFGPVDRLFDTAGTGMPQTGKSLGQLIHPEDASMRHDALMHHYHTGETLRERIPPATQRSVRLGA